jgi:5-methylcytosine-specific restriction endonuclease McrA
VNARYPAIAERAVYRCEYCHAPESVFNFPFEVEHILPQSHGGPDSLNNLALSCHACNLFKSDFETGPDEATHAEVALFHPRHDTWEQHFIVDTSQATIQGQTSTGRATVERLQMNRPRQLAARRRWIQFGVFP